VKEPWAVTFEPLFLALPAAAALLYAYTGRAAPPTRRQVLCFAGGLVLIAAALNSPLETLAVDYLLLFHLLQNVMIADWAPPLLILGLTLPMRAALLRRGGSFARQLTRMRVALPVWLLGWYVIHLGGFYDYALRNPWALNLEHLLMIAIGTVFWWPVLADTPQRRPTLLKLGYLLAGFVGSAFLGLALTFSTSVFYGYYESRPRLWDISPAKDQNLGGVLMSAEQALIFLTAISYFLIVLLREEEARERELARLQRRDAHGRPLQQ
jgi:putative membrane protein